MPEKKKSQKRKKKASSTAKTSAGTAKKLLVVESPTKAKTIKKYLGRGFEVVASKGHIKDLPKSRLGVDIEHGFEPHYITIKGKSDIIKKLKKLAARASEVYIGSDPDREGEAIAYHVAQEVQKAGQNNVKRVLFYEITKDAVKKAIKEPQEIDMKKVEAQIARRVLDRLVGYKISPLLWKSVRKGLSAGRVQTVALRLLVEREKEIQAFKPQKYWKLYVYFEKDGVRFKAQLPDRIEDREKAEKLKEFAAKSEFRVVAYSKNVNSVSPPPPFKTSTMQQDASNELGFTSRQTMRIAQQLYEGVELPGVGMTGLITYMRTDSVRMADKAVNQAREVIREIFGEEYLPPTPRKFKDKSSAVQGAHEAIRPTDFTVTPESVSAIEKPLQRLYSLIWRRATASQMADARVEVRNVKLQSGELTLVAEGKELVFEGFYRIYGRKPQNVKLPDFSTGETLKPVKVELEERETEPPKRYTEASLIRALEAKGIGRPSTYAPTIATLLDREYVVKEGRALKPTDLGILVADLLIPRFPELFDIGFTARMEEELDKIEEGQKTRLDLLREFYEKFSKELEKVESQIQEMRQQSVQVLDEKCPVCGRPLVIRWGRYGKFIACSGYPECKYTRPIFDVVEGVKCPKCGSDIIRRKSKRGRIYYACSNPECDFYLFNEPVGVKCPKCGYPLMVKVRKGRGKNSKLILRCPECGHEMEMPEDGKEKPTT